jgi:hypothetical protein
VSRQFRQRINTHERVLRFERKQEILLIRPSGPLVLYQPIPSKAPTTKLIVDWHNWKDLIV